MSPTKYDSSTKHTDQLNSSILSQETSYYTAASPSHLFLSFTENTPAKYGSTGKTRECVEKISSGNVLKSCSKEDVPINTPFRHTLKFTSSVTRNSLQSPTRMHRPVGKTVVTPDGLKPRSSINELRAKLRLPSVNLMSLPPMDPYARSRKIISSKNNKNDLNGNEKNSSAVRKTLYEMSPSGTFSVNESYSEHSFVCAAVSPYITKGCTRTAVGALVAEAEASLSKNNESGFSFATSTVSFDDGCNNLIRNKPVLGILRRTNNDHDDNWKQNVGNIGVLPSRTWMIKYDNEISRERSLNNESSCLEDHGTPTSRSIIESPISLDDSRSMHSVSHLDSPSSYSYTWRYYETSYEKLPDDPHPWNESPSLSQTYRELNTTFNSRHGLFDDQSSFEDKIMKGTYDFNEIDGIHHVKKSENDVHDHGLLHGHSQEPQYIITGGFDGESNTSSMSTITTYTFDPSSCSLGTSMSERSSFNEKSGFKSISRSSPTDNYQPNLPELSEFVLDRKLNGSKNKNEMKKKETFLIEVVQRLQHDRHLISEVEEIRESLDKLAGDLSDIGQESIFLKTSSDQDGIIMGYKLEDRNNLLNILQRAISKLEEDHIDELRSEAGNSMSEDDYKLYRASGSTQMMDESNRDLLRALRFVSSIVQTAFKSDEELLKCRNAVVVYGADEYNDSVNGQNLSFMKWKATDKLRKAINVYKLTMTPENEEYDSNLECYSPSTSITPNASNRSIATPISSPKTKAVVHKVTSPNSSSPHSLRKTLEVVATLLQKMTLACSQMMKVGQGPRDKFILVTEELKRRYLQLMALNMSDLSALHGSFALVNTKVIDEIEFESQNQDKNNQSTEKLMKKEVKSALLDLNENDDKCSPHSKICESKVSSQVVLDNFNVALDGRKHAAKNLEDSTTPNIFTSEVLLERPPNVIRKLDFSENSIKHNNNKVLGEYNDNLKFRGNDKSKAFYTSHFVQQSLTTQGNINVELEDKENRALGDLRSRVEKYTFGVDETQSHPVVKKSISCPQIDGLHDDFLEFDDEDFINHEHNTKRSSPSGDIRDDGPITPPHNQIM